MIRLFDNVEILKLSAFLGKRFTSCPGIGSSILSVDQGVVRHLLPPLVAKDLTTIIFQVNILELTKIWILINIRIFYGERRARIT